MKKSFNLYFFRGLLEIYNYGFSCKNITYPLDNFISITLFDDKNSLKKYSDANLIVLGEDYIQFNRAFKKDEAIKVVKINVGFGCFKKN